MRYPSNDYNARHYEMTVRVYILKMFGIRHEMAYENVKYEILDGCSTVVQKVYEHDALKYHANLQLGHNHHSSCHLTSAHTQCFVALVMFCSGNFTTLQDLIRLQDVIRLQDLKKLQVIICKI